jgi:hypothetical protein
LKAFLAPPPKQDKPGRQSCRVINRTVISRRDSCPVLRLEGRLSEDEYSLFSLYLTVDSTMNTFAASSDFGKEKEPAYINRHWTMHGRAERRKTKMDCVKLLRFLYAIILLDRIEKENPQSLSL